MSEKRQRTFEEALAEWERKGELWRAAKRAAKPPPKPKLEAEVLEWPKIIARDRYQQMLDAAQDLWLQRQRELEAEAARSCHRGPGDDDYPGRR